MSAGKAVLLLVDLQERLVPAMHDGERVVGRAARLAEAATLLEVPVLATEQVPEKLGPTVERLAGLPHLVMPKTRFAADDGVLFPPGRSEIVVAGVEAHVCVLQTVLELLADDRRARRRRRGAAAHRRRHRVGAAGDGDRTAPGRRVGRSRRRDGRGRADHGRATAGTRRTGGADRGGRCGAAGRRRLVRRHHRAAGTSGAALAVAEAVLLELPLALAGAVLAARLLAPRR